MWTVDEARAERVNGFSCVYRTPAHLELGVSGAVPCGPPAGGAEATHTALSPAAARTRVVGGLPEFGDYDFEVVANVDPGEVIEWPMRALRVRVEVTPEFAGPPGLDRAVTGTGPLVTGCGPDGGPGDASAGRPWQLDQIVSAAHLTHYPGRGWSGGGDPAAAPEWPDPPSLATLFDEAGLDGGALQQVLTDPGANRGSALAVITDDRALDPLGRASAGTKALLRRGVSGSAGAGAADGSAGAGAADGSAGGAGGTGSAGAGAANGLANGSAYGWELRLHSSYPFGADYVYETGHAVPGWDDAGHPVAWPQLWNRVDCPPPRWPSATHDVALALSDDAAGRRLQHSGYGWWAVAPVGAMPERIVATKGGLSYGDPAPTPLARPAAPTATYVGRASGHLFFGLQRYALAGDLTLTLEQTGDGDGDGDGDTTQLTGRIDNVVFVALDHDGLEPLPGPPVEWRSLTLDAGDAGAPAAGEGVWSGAARVDGDTPLTDSPGLPPADAFTGDWRAEAYGPLAQEIAGRLRIWTPLPEGANPAQGWPEQALLVVGFGGRTP